MQISYSPLWEILKKRNMKKKDLIEKAQISANCVAKMGKNESISLRNLYKICVALSCTLNDVVEFSPKISARKD